MKTNNALTLAQDAEVRRILANVADLPIGGKLLLPDLANDGFGGMYVKRARTGTASKTWVFQREFYMGRSRWAHGLAECIEELETYVLTGHLREPDRIVGF